MRSSLHSVLFSGAPEAKPAPGPKIQLLCKVPCALEQLRGGCCKLRCSSSHGRSPALSKAGIHSMAHPGHSPSPDQGRGLEEGIPQVLHREQVL